MDHRCSPGSRCACHLAGAHHCVQQPQRCLLHYQRDLLDSRKCALLAQFFDPKVDPFYSSYNVGKHTYAPFKVVWKEICPEIESVVVASEDETIIPDHKLLLVAFQSKAPANFYPAFSTHHQSDCLCGARHADLDSDHIFDYVALPEYSPKDPLHAKVVELSEKCHTASDAGETRTVESLEEKLAKAVAEVLRIPAAKLQVMRDELGLLRGSVPASSDQDE
jgi:hypothetical protein